MQLTKMWEIRGTDDSLVGVSVHPSFDLSNLKYGQYIRCVQRVVSPEKCFNGCDLHDQENRLMDDGFCESCHDYPEG